MVCGVPGGAQPRPAVANINLRRVHGTSYLSSSCGGALSFAGTRTDLVRSKLGSPALRPASHGDSSALVAYRLRGHRSRLRVEVPASAFVRQVAIVELIDERYSGRD